MGFIKTGAAIAQAVVDGALFHAERLGDLGDGEPLLKGKNAPLYFACSCFERLAHTAVKFGGK
jgi:hypothetical protein